MSPPSLIFINEELTIRPADTFEDYWLIERANHEHRGWLQPEEYGASYQWTGRISDADVEGTGAEMREIARAILDGREFHAKRCAVAVTPGLAHFWSPRNSRKTATVPLERAEALADKIDEILGTSE